MSVCKKKYDKNSYILSLNLLIFFIQIFFVIRIFQFSNYANNISASFQDNIDGYINDFDNKLKKLVYNEKDRIYMGINNKMIPLFDEKISDIRSDIGDELENIFEEVNKTKDFLSKYSFLINYIDNIDTIFVEVNQTKKFLSKYSFLINYLNNYNITTVTTKMFSSFIEDIKNINRLLQILSVRVESIDNQLSYLNYTLFFNNKINIPMDSNIDNNINSDIDRRSSFLP